MVVVDQHETQHYTYCTLVVGSKCFDVAVVVVGEESEMRDDGSGDVPQEDVEE